MGAPATDTSNVYVGNPAAISLGKKFYFDKDFSGTEVSADMLLRPMTTPGRAAINAAIKVSCNTCHDVTKGGGDQTPDPPGNRVSIGGGAYDLNSQQSINSAYSDLVYWNGRNDSLWSQIVAVGESHVSVNGSRMRVAWRINVESAGVEQKPIPQGAFLHGVGELRPERFAAVRDCDVGERATVVNKDSGQVLERRCLIVGPKARQPRPELGQASEPLRIAMALDLGEGGMRQESEQPPVARPDDIQQQQRSGTADQRRTPVTGRSDPRIGDLGCPPAAMVVEPTRDPTLLPRLTIGSGQPVQHHDQPASPLTIEDAEPDPVACADERVEAGQHRGTIGGGLRPHRRPGDRRDIKHR